MVRPLYNSSPGMYIAVELAVECESTNVYR